MAWHALTEAKAPELNVFTLVKDGDLWAVTLTRRSSFKPVYIRTVWRPRAYNDRMLLPDRLIGARVDGSGGRWTVRDPLTQQTITLHTDDQGTREEAGWVPKPTGRPRSSWYWDFGEWQVIGAGSVEDKRHDHWHWLEGERKPSPPTDPAEARKKAEG